jgi:hypothetical protein
MPRDSTARHTEKSTAERVMGSSGQEPAEQTDQPSILGSAEPLSPEATAARLRALAAWGVDLSLIRATLELTPTERPRRMADFLAVGAALHQSYLQLMSSQLPPRPHPRPGVADHRRQLRLARHPA